MKATVFHNPGAGSGHPNPEEIRSALQTLGYSVESRSVKDDEWKEPVGDDTDLLVVAGGDGTLRRVFRKLAGTSLPILVLPLGTANNLARSFGLDPNWEKVVGDLPNMKTEPFYIGEVRWDGKEDLFFESVGLGLFADVIHLSENHEEVFDQLGKGKKGPPRALIAMARATREAEAISVRIQSPDVWEAESIWLEVMNIPSIGSRLGLGEPEDVQNPAGFPVYVAGREDADALSSWFEAQSNGHKGNRPDLKRVDLVEAISLSWDGKGFHIDDQAIYGERQRQVVKVKRYPTPLMILR